MLNPIKEIYSWQKAAGNLEKKYDDFLESSFQVEEALEGFDLNSFEDCDIGFNPLDNPNAKEVSRMLVKIAMNSGNEEIEDVDRLDKACDAIVYAIGSIAKLGLDHHGITKALNIVNAANKAKLGMPRDEHGKLLKPDDFVGPEVELQKLLDSYKK
jgi:predicted HAD superfamily Cof-like phosphohydrolase